MSFDVLYPHVPLDNPHVDIELSIPARFEEVSYFANGPHENFPDRNIFAHVGVYQEKIADNLSTYVVPQEQGN